LCLTCIVYSANMTTVATSRTKRTRHARTSARPTEPPHRGETHCKAGLRLRVPLSCRCCASTKPHRTGGGALTILPGSEIQVTDTPPTARLRRPGLFATRRRCEFTLSNSVEPEITAGCGSAFYDSLVAASAAPFRCGLSGRHGVFSGTRQSALHALGSAGALAADNGVIRLGNHGEAAHGGAVNR